MRKTLERDPFFSKRIQNFHKLMRFKVRDILLVSSLYDSYLFEEDGRLYELIRQEYQAFNFNHSPDITHVSSGKDAIELALNDSRYDMIITTLHVEDMHAVQFAKMVRQAGLDIPIILLAFDNRERKELVTYYDVSIFDRIFIWQGDFRLIMGIVKYIEDKLNVKNDTEIIGVQVIILIEDNVKFYSSYLPQIYGEIFFQAQRLIAEGLNLSHQFLRQRARPKILLCTNYEEAWNYFEEYKEYILGIISDVNFKRNGVKDPEAGITFAKRVKEEVSDIPILLQSSNIKHSEKAHEIGASFLLKGSPMLLRELSDFMKQYFSFGDFTFRLADGTEVGKATDLKSLEEMLRTVPDESIKYHAERNHFSNWLKARTEFWLADRLRPRKVEDFASITELRNDLIDSLNFYREQRKKGVITDFDKESFDPYSGFARIGGGSLGGKARGLGFINILLNEYKIQQMFEGVSIIVPAAVTIGTEIFDRFLEENNLKSFALNAKDDHEINRRFLEADKFPTEFILKLYGVLEVMNYPLAVRSSSLLEDSQYQPFAGVYSTHMLPNNSQDINTRLRELLSCIKRIYASTFYQSSKDYMRATSYRLEEEKMAIVIQRLIGSEHEERYYPDFAGVGKSYNFYPSSPQKPADGIALVALGLGKTVVDGGSVVRFCPKYPKHLPQFSNAVEVRRSTQKEFYALDLKSQFDDDFLHSPEELMKKYDLSIAEHDETLYNVGSTYSPENEAIYDGLSRSGSRLVTFAPILKQGIFPLPQILDLMLEIGSNGMGSQVEIEFAVNMRTAPGQPKEFAMLQMRPLVISQESEALVVDGYEKSDLLCSSVNALGNGAVHDVYDIIMVDPKTFERSKTNETALEVSIMNTKMLNEAIPYILIGMGRWGSLDPWLGIPVHWDQIAGASVIVETGFKDFQVAPSQGSHFFQNITSFNVGYFTVNENPDDFVDWDWLNSIAPVESMTYVKRLHFESPLSIKINGLKNKGIILKPEEPQDAQGHA
jgi:CheY-like chemotaxis protein